MNELSWLFTGLSILGAVLNAFGKIAGFYVWVIANLCWISFDIYQHLYSQILMFVVYTVTSIIGIVVWRRKKNGKN